MRGHKVQGGGLTMFLLIVLLALFIPSAVSAQLSDAKRRDEARKQMRQP